MKTPPGLCLAPYPPGGGEAHRRSRKNLHVRTTHRAQD